MKFNPEVSLGTIITIACFLITLVAMHTANIRRIERIELQVQIMFKWFQENIISPRERDRDYDETGNR